MFSQIFADINWIAVLTAAIAYFVLGALWYSVLFGKKWIAYVGIDMSSPNAKKGTGIIMLTSFIMMFVCSVGIAILIAKLDLQSCMAGAKLGLLTGICFSATAIHISYVYEKRPPGLHLINGFYNIAGNIIAAIIISCWR